MGDRTPGDSVVLFEEDGLWDRFEGNPHLEERTRIVMEMLPRDTATVLDVGCGNGLLVEAVSATRFAVGIDPSLRGLRLFERPRICGVGEHLPFREKSFDLVCCLEVLEHLDEEALTASARELGRVARQWILVATPDREDPRRNSIRCPRCGLLFNRSHHLQSFDEARLRDLFPDFTVMGRRFGGQPVRPYPAWLLWVRHRLARRYYKGPRETEGICPRCGNRDFPPFRPNLLSVLLDGLNRLISPRRPYWILLLLERR